MTIHRPVGTAARVKVTGGASGIGFDDQSYKAVGGEAHLEDLRLRAGDRPLRHRLRQGRPRPGGRHPRAPPPPRPPAAGHGPVHRHRRLDPAGPGAGDQRWRELLDAHDEAARRLIGREGGRWVKSTGDGVLAVFDGPGRAIRCALALRTELRGIGIEIGPASTPGSSTSSTTTSAGSPSTSPPASWPPPARRGPGLPDRPRPRGRLGHRPGGPRDPCPQGP